MRVLVVGTVPPPGGSVAKELAGIAAERSETGDEVCVFSPDPRSAAHYTGNLRDLLLPIRLALLSPKFDALVLRIEAGLPLGEQTNRLVRAATLFSLGLVVRMFSEVTLRLDSPIPLPGGIGGRATTDLWKGATSIVVANEEDRQRMLAAPGVDPERVEIAVPMVVTIERSDDAWPNATTTDLREQVLERIRRRTRAERRANSARVDLGAVGVGPLTSTTFSAGSPVRPSGVLVAKAACSRIVRELLMLSPKAK